MSTPDRPVSKDDLFQSVWGYDLVGGADLVEVAIRRSEIESDHVNTCLLAHGRRRRYKFNSQGATRHVAVAD